MSCLQSVWHHTRSLLDSNSAATDGKDVAQSPETPVISASVPPNELTDKQRHFLNKKFHIFAALLEIIRKSVVYPNNYILYPCHVYMRYAI